MKVFIILSRIPYPLVKGDKLRAFNQIKELSKKHEIYLCCLSDCDYEESWIEEVKKYCVDLKVIRLRKWTIYINILKQVFTGLPFQVGYFYNNKAQKIIDKAIESFSPDHIYCQLIRTSEYVKKNYEIPKTIDYMDALSMGMKRRMESAKGWMKWLYKSEYRRLLRYENIIFDYFDFHTIISEYDKKQIYHPNQRDIVVVPNGVGEMFREPLNIEKKYTLVFTGNMMYPPNISGAVFLVNKILPLLKLEIPEASVIISGANPHKSVMALASDDVHITGWTEDIRYSICSALVFVAPMEIGSGVQNKLLESMSLGIPCIASELANKGLNAEHGKEILIANTPDTYVEYIVKLLNDEKIYNDISENGKKYVSENFSWESSTKILSNLFLKKTYNAN